VFTDPPTVNKKWDVFTLSPRMDVDTGSDAARIVGLTADWVAVLVSSPAPAWSTLASGVRELVQLALDEVSLGGSGVELERALVGVDGVGGAAESLEQVGAGDVQRGPARELGVVGDRVEMTRPAAGPSAIATATARLASCTGVGS